VATDSLSQSRGAVLLIRWLKRTKTTQRCFARRVDVTAGALNQWLMGHTTPTLEHAVEVEIATSGSVPAAEWAQKESG
jgi:DNA-binding transcriptional regulator YdaS (Cro superfamily)